MSECGITDPVRHRPAAEAALSAVGDGRHPRMDLATAPSVQTACLSEGILAAQVSRAARYESVDMCRVIAALGVIWLHVNSTNYLGGLGKFRMTFFTILSVFLACRSALQKPQGAAGSAFRKRLVRLMVPFAAWKVIYGVVPAVLAGILLDPDILWTYVSNPLLFRGGKGAVHLWYLPFIFFATLFAVILTRWAMRLSRRSLLVVCSAVAALVCWHMVVIPYDTALQSYVNNRMLDRILHLGSSVSMGFFFLSASIGLGFLLAIAERFVPQYFSTRNWNLTLMALAGWVAFVLLTVMRIGPTNLVATLSGLCLLLAGIHMPSTRIGLLVAKLSKYTFGTYLVHMLFVPALALLHLETRMGELPAVLLGFVLVTAASFGLVALMQTTRITRSIVGGN